MSPIQIAPSLLSCDLSRIGDEIRDIPIGARNIECRRRSLGRFPVRRANRRYFDVRKKPPCRAMNLEAPVGADDTDLDPLVCHVAAPHGPGDCLTGLENI